MENVSLPAPTKDIAASMIGMWKLNSRVDVDASGQRRIDPILGADPLGILCFAAGYFAMQLMKRDRSDQKSAPSPVQGNNNSLAVDGYDAYFGSYKLDEKAGTLATHIEGSIAESNIGSTFVRDIRVVGNELMIQLPTTGVDGTAVRRTLTFSRIE